MKSLREWKMEDDGDGGGEGSGDEKVEVAALRRGRL